MVARLSPTWPADVRAVTLTGLTLTNSAVVAGDTVLVALGKLQAQLANSVLNPTFNAGTLGTTALNTVPNVSFNDNNGNTSSLNIFEWRTSTGTGWTTAARRIQHQIDSFPKGFIDFSPAGAIGGLGLGSGAIATTPIYGLLMTTSGAVTLPISLVVTGATTLATLTTSGLISANGGLSTTSNLTVSGNTTLAAVTSTGVTTGVNAQTNSYLTINGSGGRYLLYQTNGLNRWIVYADSDAESGGNAGSSFKINRYNDAGTFLDTSVIINRASGLTTLTSLTVGGTVSGAGITALHAAPGPLGNTTPSTGAFTALSASGTTTLTGPVSITEPATINIPQLLFSPGSGTAGQESRIGFIGTFPTGAGDTAAYAIGELRAGFSAYGWNTQYFDIWLNNTTSGVYNSANMAQVARFTLGGLSTTGLTVTGAATVASVALGAAGPTWTTGTAVPASTAPVGSLYSRVGGTLGATLYVSRGGGAWAAVAGV